MSEWWTPKARGVKPSKLFSYEDDKPIRVVRTAEAVLSEKIEKSHHAQYKVEAVEPEPSLSENEIADVVRAFILG